MIKLYRMPFKSLKLLGLEQALALIQYEKSQWAGEGSLETRYIAPEAVKLKLALKRRMSQGLITKLNTGSKPSNPNISCYFDPDVGRLLDFKI